MRGAFARGRRKFLRNKRRKAVRFRLCDHCSIRVYHGATAAVPELVPDAMEEAVFYHARAVCGFCPDGDPGAGFEADPDADTVVARGGRVIAVGSHAQMRREHGASAATHRLPGHVLLPGLVNAHTHLELTAVGPRTYGGDFVGWVDMLREAGPSAAAAADGARAAAAAGVQAVGDIASDPAARAARVDAALGGTTFVELFGLGPPHDAAALARVGESADGFQPHAPYSAGPALFAAAAASGRPVCTHLAETRDEAQFVACGTGPFRALLERLGKWSPRFADGYGAGASPVAWMAPHLRRCPWLVAHGNYLDDADIALLAETGASIAYCPVASDYFGHRGHRYRELLEAGVNVCLGTDSVVCQPPDGDPSQWLSVLPQMRHLYQRDGFDPGQLLSMATARGRRALGLGDAVTRLCAVPVEPDAGDDPLRAVLAGRGPGRAVHLDDPLPRR